MNADEPIVTDPTHLSNLAGTAFLVLRPEGPVDAVFRRVQDQLRHVVGDDPSWWPSSHLSLKSFGNANHHVDAATESKIVAFAEAWARSTPPLTLTVDALDVFTEEQVPIIVIRRNPGLSAALEDVRARGRAAELPGDADRIAVRDWVFHLSLMYYRGERWPAIEEAVGAMTVRPEREVIGRVEVRAFDGGPERLVASFPLAR